MADGEFQFFDERFTRCISQRSRVERLYEGCIWAEGPAYFAVGGYLVWSDIPNDRMLRWDETNGAVDVFRQPSGYTNGNTLDGAGRLVTCEHGARRVTRTEYDGSITFLVDRFDGKRLNSPNDVVVASDGAIWFTDPTYGIDSNEEGYEAESEIGGSNVYRFDPASEECRLVADDLVQPNGLAFSLDERMLYVSDTGATHVPDGPRHIRAFDVSPGATLSGGEVLATCTAGLFDGLRLDDSGRLWTSAGDGVHCYEPDGTLIGKVLVPETVSNVAFGGPGRNRLFITATTSLYSVLLPVKGAPLRLSRR